MKRQLAILLAAFPLSGLMTVLQGTLLPWLAEAHAVSDGSAGALFAIQFLAATAVSASYGWTAGRRPAVRIVAVSYLVMAAGAAACAAGSLPAARAGVALYGAGLGLNIASVNLAVARTGALPAVRALNLLNAFWGAGAVAGPAIVAWALARAGLPVVMGSLSLTLAAAAAASFTLRSGSTGPESGRRQKRGMAGPLPWAPLLYLFLYVGAETCLSGWLPTLGRRLLGLDPPGAALAQSLFWLSILAGRVLSAAVAAAAPLRWMAAGLGVAGAGLILVLRPAGPAAFYLGASLAGLGLAPQFPTAVALCQHQFPARAAAWTGLLLAGGGLGGALWPWLLGLSGEALGSLPLAAGGVLALLAAMFFLLPALGAGS